jgi:hypothetical protein
LDRVVFLCCVRSPLSTGNSSPCILWAAHLHQTHKLPSRWLQLLPEVLFSDRQACENATHPVYGVRWLGYKTNAKMHSGKYYHGAGS